MFAILATERIDIVALQQLHFIPCMIRCNFSFLGLTLTGKCYTNNIKWVVNIRNV